MAQTLVYTGSPGAGIALAAAAEALRAADSGRRTLLLSLGPPAGLGALLGVPVGGTPAEAAPRLDTLALDPAAELASAWDRARPSMPAPFATIGGDEVPLPPVGGVAFALLRLRELAPRYEQIVVDAGPHDMLLAAIGLPDTLRWTARLMIGVDGDARGTPPRATLLPGLLLPLEFTEHVRTLLAEAERLRDLLTPPAGLACYVLRPDATALAEARLAIPALQLHGLAAAAIVAGPLLPTSPDDLRLAPLERLQATLLDEAAALWPTRPIRRFEVGAESGGRATLLAAGRAIGAITSAPPRPPIGDTHQGTPALTVDLPGLPSGALGLTLSGDDMVIRLGPYRRHLPLPPALRGTRAIRATREGDTLVIRRRA